MYRTNHTGYVKYFPIFGKISSLSAKEISKRFLRVFKYVRESLNASIGFSGKLPSGAAWRAQFRQHNDPSIVRTILFSAHSALFRSILSDIWSSPVYTHLRTQVCRAMPPPTPSPRAACPPLSCRTFK